MLSDIRRRLQWRVLACGLLLLGTSTAGAQVGGKPTPVLPPPADVNRPADPTGERPVGGLRPGDVLKVLVWKEKDLTGEYLIDARGYVQIPGAGVMKVAGLEPQQAQQVIIDALKARGITDPQVAVQAMVRVSVLGEVRQPALYPVEPGTSLLQVVTLAGGPTERANLNATRVVRDGRSFVVDLESGLSGGGAGRVVLYSGDYVIIPRRKGFSRETFSFVLSTVTAVASFISLAVTLSRR